MKKDDDMKKYPLLHASKENTIKKAPYPKELYK